MEGNGLYYRGSHTGRLMPKLIVETQDWTSLIGKSANDNDRHGTIAQNPMNGSDAVVNGTILVEVLNDTFIFGVEQQ